jgi:hypothetical protein
MNKIDFKLSLLLAPLAYALHHFEESIIFNFRAWRQKYFWNTIPLTTETVFVILTAITLIVIITHMVLDSKASAQIFILFVIATQVHNIFFHAILTLVFWDFSPGLITAVILYAPVNTVILYKGYQENLVSKKSLLVIFILGGIAYWSWEVVGPIVILIFLIIAFIWLALKTYKTSRLSKSSNVQ